MATGGLMGEITGGIKGGIKTAKALYIKGFRHFDGRDSVFSKKICSYSFSETSNCEISAIFFPIKGNRSNLLRFACKELFPPWE